MTTEQRQNFRLLMTLQCAINTGEHGFRRCRTRDISHEGAFVLGDTSGLALNSFVTLAVQTSTNGQTQVRHFRAVVRHLTESGMGLYVKGARALLEAVLAKRNQGPGLNGAQQRSALLG